MKAKQIHEFQRGRSITDQTRHLGLGNTILHIFMNLDNLDYWGYTSEDDSESKCWSVLKTELINTIARLRGTEGRDIIGKPITIDNIKYNAVHRLNRDDDEILMGLEDKMDSNVTKEEAEKLVQADTFPVTDIFIK